jgi:hypothetical protein
MSSRHFSTSRHAHVGIAAATAIILLCATPSAWPQVAPAAPQAAPAAPPARDENPGLVNEIGKLLKDPSSLLPSFGSPRESSEPPKPEQPTEPAAAEAAKPATAPPAQPADNPSRPILPSMVSGRAVCPISADGGPDCKAGADTLCRSKGFTEGKSLVSDAVQKCSAKLLIPGRQRQPGDCRTESFVTRAWCQ